MVRPKEAVPVGLNGLGDTGLSVVHRLFERDGKPELVAINSRFSRSRPDDIPFQVASLVKFPQPDRPWREHVVDYGKDFIEIDGRRVGVTHSDTIEKINWLTDRPPRGVIDSTGVFKDYGSLSKYFKGDSVQWVVLTSPPKNDPSQPKIPAVVFGANDSQILNRIDSCERQIISAASCTTMCLAPLVNILDRNFGIIQGFVSTTHAQTGSHTLFPGDAKEPALMHPVDDSFAIYRSGADDMLREVLPHLAAKFPLPVTTIRGSPKAGSILSVIVQVGISVDADRVNRVFENCAGGAYRGIVNVISKGDLRDLSNSSVCVGDTHSALVMARHTIVSGDWVQVMALYDNVGAYAARVVDLSEAVSQRM